MKIKGKETLETRESEKRAHGSLQTKICEERARVWMCVCVCVGGWYLAWFVFIWTSQPVTALFMCLTEAAASCVCECDRELTRSLCLYFMLFISSTLFTHFILNFVTSLKKTACFSHRTMKKTFIFYCYLSFQTCVASPIYGIFLLVLVG